MSTDVVMPQMGESIAEGTVVRWIKKVGDKVDRDEPLFEISTDKVDAEVPSPAAGVVSEIRVKEGETVPVNSIVAVIGQAADAAVTVRTGTTGAAPSPTPAPPKPSPQGDGATAPTPGPTAPPVAPSAPVAGPAPVGPSAPAALRTTEDAIHQRSSPLVRRIAKENNVDLSQLRGS